MDAATTVAVVGVGGTVLGGVLAFLGNLVTTRATARQNQRLREHEERRLKEERENEARIRAEDREAELARLRFDREVRVSDEMRQEETAAEQAKREVGRSFVVLAQRSLQSLHLDLEKPSAEDWQELTQALGRVTATFDSISNSDAAACVAYLRGAATDSAGRAHNLQQAQMMLENFAARVRRNLSTSSGQVISAIPERRPLSLLVG